MDGGWSLCRSELGEGRRIDLEHFRGSVDVLARLGLRAQPGLKQAQSSRRVKHGG